MRSRCAPFGLVVVLLALCAPRVVAAAPPPVAAPIGAATAQRLVQAALAAGIAGDSGKRAQLLAEALAADPDYAPARWHSGYVRIANAWVKVDDVPKHVVDDEHLAAYRQKRDRAIDTADGHRELARFCRKHQLLDEERVHWAHVLEFNPQDAEALRALNLELYAGRLMTKKQIAAEKVAAGKRLEAMRAWRPKLLKLRYDIEGGIPKRVDQAITALKQIDDPEAIPALEATFAVDGAIESVILVNRALIQTLGRMPDPRATEVLLRRAVGAENEQVRDEAIDELKKRPLHAYVPQLIAALPGSIKTKFHVYVLPAGTVMHEHEVLLEGRDANLSMVLNTAVQPADLQSQIWATPVLLGRDLNRAATIENQARTTQAQLDQQRQRLQYVLARTTGFENADDPQLWQRQYNDHYGWQYDAPAKPTVTFTANRVEQVSEAPTDTTTTLGRSRSHSCFPAGTTVWTAAGPRAIEDVKLGDRVLSQDPQSGELAYKPVHAATLRASVPLIEIDLGSEKLLTTAGHPFWVAGAGWRTAQQLKPGSRLHTLDGTIEVRKIEPGRTIEVYNFVVSELHNYFVGSAKLLVHDNSPLVDSGRSLPGLTAAAVAGPGASAD